MNKNEKKEDFLSLNKSLLDEFSLEELESRLETDPLAVGQLLQLTTTENSMDVNMDGCCLIISCNEH